MEMERVYKMQILGKARYYVVNDGKLTQSTEEAYEAWKHREGQPENTPTTAKERILAFGKRHGITFGADMDEETLSKAGW